MPLSDKNLQTLHYTKFRHFNQRPPRRGAKANATLLGRAAPYVIASEAKQSPPHGVEIASSLRSSQ
jgi:hypothetical protein